MSNVAIYNAFGSRAGLVGRVWLRAAGQFLALQRDAIARTLAEGSGRDSAVEAVVAAADTPAVFAIEHPVSARFLLTVRREELLGSGDIPADMANGLRRLEQHWETCSFNSPGKNPVRPMPRLTGTQRAG